MERKHITIEATIVILVLAVVFGVLYMMSYRNTNSVKTPAGNTTTTQRTISQVTIVVTGCAPEPKTKFIEKGSVVTFINKDSVAHTIAFSPAFKFVVPAKGQHVQIFNIWSKPGVRSYSCDEKKAVGEMTMYLSS